MSLKEKLLNIQSELKAPKGQFNSFGKYKYRSCEDILEAVKPLLKANKCTLQICDDLRMVGDRYYIVAITTIYDTETDENMVNMAYAREADTKTGMDCSQITGTASSYARKYALNGLFLIDDTKDADTDEHAEQTKQEKAEKVEKMATDKQIEVMRKIAEGQGKPFDETKARNMTMKAASDLISKYKEAK